MPLPATRASTTDWLLPAGALALNADIAEAHLPLAWHFALRGDFAEADAEIETALGLNPDCWEANKEGARILYRQGRLDEAQVLLERACELAESDFHSPGMLIAILLGRGDHAPIRQRAERMSELVGQAMSRDPSNGAAIAYSALAHAVLGRGEKAREMVERAILLDPDNLYMRYNLAWPMIAFLDDAETAMELLAPALAGGGISLISLAAADRNLNSIRDDPRFAQLLAAAKMRVGLPSSGPPAA